MFNRLKILLHLSFAFRLYLCFLYPCNFLPLHSPHLLYFFRLLFCPICQFYFPICLFLPLRFLSCLLFSSSFFFLIPLRLFFSPLPSLLFPKYLTNAAFLFFCSFCLFLLFFPHIPLSFFFFTPLLFYFSDFFLRVFLIPSHHSNFYPFYPSYFSVGVAAASSRSFSLFCSWTLEHQKSGAPRQRMKDAPAAS